MIRLALCLLVLLIGSNVMVTGFDTGHHNDLTRNSLEAMGYNTDAQKVAALCNFFDDYFAYTLDFEVIEEVKSLHFDNLITLENVTNYMTQLLINGRTAARNAATANDPLRYLCVLGAGLHAIQDFYTHSSWVELHQGTCDCLRDDTWFSALNQTDGNSTLLLEQLVSLRTYTWGPSCETYEHNCFPGIVSHGDYCTGVNKDSYNRPFFHKSYAFAFVGSIEWLFNFEAWATQVNADFVNAAKQYIAPDLEQLNEDTDNMITIAYATKTVFQDDGHWKGAGSGDFARFIASGADFISDSSIYKQQFTERQVYKDLTDPPLYLTPTATAQQALEFYTPYFALPGELQNWTAVVVRTNNLDIPDVLVNTPSPYAVVTIGGLPFVESVQMDRTNFRPHWTSIKFVPRSLTSIQINYSLFNEEFVSDDDLVSIAAGDGSLNVTMDLQTNGLTGDVSGVFQSASNVLTSTSGENSVSLFMYTIPVGNCDVELVIPEPFCPNEAYTQIGLHPYCDDRNERK